jgi:hypothetical protein
LTQKVDNLNRTKWESCKAFNLLQFLLNKARLCGAKWCKAGLGGAWRGTLCLLIISQFLLRTSKCRPGDAKKFIANAYTKLARKS